MLAAVTATGMERATQWCYELVGWTVDLGIVLIVLGMIICVLRIVRGPHMADRAVGADTMGVQLVGLILLLSIRFETLMFFDGILIVSLLAFAGTVAMAQYIARLHHRRQHQAEE